MPVQSVTEDVSAVSTADNSHLDMTSQPSGQPDTHTTATTAANNEPIKHHTPRKDYYSHPETISDSVVNDEPSYTQRLLGDLDRPNVSEYLSADNSMSADEPPALAIDEQPTLTLGNLSADPAAPFRISMGSPNYNHGVH